MPNYAKLILSVLVTIVAVIFHLQQAQDGRAFNSWLAIGLGAFMILAIWLFPETGRAARKDGR